MNKLFPLLLVLLSGCFPTEESLKPPKTTFITTLYHNGNYTEMMSEVVLIDGCEYIATYSKNHYTYDNISITHKGNCLFCQEKQGQKTAEKENAN